LNVRPAVPGLYEITTRRGGVAAGRADGLLTLMIQHTSASLLIQEKTPIPDVQTDLRLLDRLVPPATDPGMRWLTHTLRRGRRHAGAYQGGASAGQPADPGLGGRMRLGTWQGLYVVEHRTRAHLRRVAAHFAPSG
jgi:secondary thiamine-phosphate synthase enzyme